MQSYTSSQLDSCESLEDDHASRYYDAYEGEEQSDNSTSEKDQGTLIATSESTYFIAPNDPGIRPSSARTASVPINQYGGIGSHRRSSNSTSQTHSRPTTSGQTSSKAASTAPTSTHSARPNSRRYSTLISPNGPSGFLPRDTRSLLRRSVTTAPTFPANSHTSFPIAYLRNDNEKPPPTIRGVSYPGRPSEPIQSHTPPTLPLTPSSSSSTHTTTPHSPTSPSPTPHQQQTYTNYHPPTTIDWTSPQTRRKHYSKIDNATTGLRGLWTRFAPKRLGGGSKYGSFYGARRDDGGSVRRFRQEVGGEGGRKERRGFWGRGR
jgi:hypothetical protein